MSKRLLIIGAGGHGKVIADIASQMNQWNEIAFVDDYIEEASIEKFPVIGKTNLIDEEVIQQNDFFVAIGNNQKRKEQYDSLKNKNANLVTIIHPSAVISENVNIGDGTAIMPGAIINTMSVIGDACIINTNASIDHDTVIEDYVHISPGVNVAGSSHIGTLSWLGIGSTIINNVSICSESMIGAGAVVVNNIREQGTYVGIPAKKVIR